LNRGKDPLQKTSQAIENHVNRGMGGQRQALFEILELRLN
jgi:hypothetical protein